MIRAADEDDLAFIVSTWSRSYKSSPAAGLIASEDWPTVMHPQIRKLIDRPGVTTLVACDRRDSSFLIGFACATPAAKVLHYVYVKQPFRRAGYARQLVLELGIDPLLPFRFTCWTHACRELAAKIPRATHDPNPARYSDAQPGDHDR
jgi:hypothetical protein